MAHKWYAIQTYAGSEMSVKRAIENLVRDILPFGCRMLSAMNTRP